jgi:hypothetical protein
LESLVISLKDKNQFNYASKSFFGEIELNNSLQVGAKILNFLSVFSWILVSNGNCLSLWPTNLFLFFFSDVMKCKKACKNTDAQENYVLSVGNFLVSKKKKTKNPKNDRKFKT